jgi:hypothetical protein
MRCGNKDVPQRIFSFNSDHYLKMGNKGYFAVVRPVNRMEIDGARLLGRVMIKTEVGYAPG